MSAIEMIQVRCKFYNYEMAQNPLPSDRQIQPT